MGRRPWLRWWPLVVAALLCACSETPGERSADGGVGVNARTDKVDPGGPATTRDWLSAMVGRLQDEGSVPFTARVRIMGNEAMLIDGEASRSGFRVAITQVGLPSARFCTCNASSRRPGGCGRWMRRTDGLEPGRKWNGGDSKAEWQEAFARAGSTW